MLLKVEKSARKSAQNLQVTRVEFAFFGAEFWQNIVVTYTYSIHAVAY